jgi:transcriptional regulator with XRE-family HTH domain
MSVERRADYHGGMDVGSLVREWRTARGLSQLELAMRAGFSTRHLSFIETGRSHPSRQALLTLADTLDVPLRERNHLLEAGGFARVYRQTPLDAEEMRHIRGVLQFILDRHEPYGAVVLDRYANLLMANQAAHHLFSALVDSSLFADTPNVLRMVFHPLGARRSIVNWHEVARHLYERARREFGPVERDDVAAALLAEVRSYVGDLAEAPPPSALRPGDLLLPVHIKQGDRELRMFSTIMTLGTPQDVTLQELRIETFFPADAQSAARWSPAGKWGRACF